MKFIENTLVLLTLGCLGTSVYKVFQEGVYDAMAFLILGASALLIMAGVKAANDSAARDKAMKEN